MTEKDYYKILEVNKGDSIDIIKKNYKKLALKYHPDKVEGEKKTEYENKFKAINEAYTTLSDEGKRRQYDAGGRGNSFNQRSSSRSTRSGGFSDIFGDIFGGGSFEEEESSSNQDLYYRVTIEFIEAAFGCEKEILIKKDILCESCGGSGSEDDDFDTCDKCKGYGRIEMGQQTPWGLMRRTVKCDRCDGTGKIPKKKCKKCKGSGIVNKKERIKIQIPKGIDDGQTLRVPNAGNARRNGSKGNLFLTIQVKPHKIFKRERFDIFMDLRISFAQAALGCDVSIPTLKDKIKIKIAKGTESGSVLRLKEKGIPFIDDPNYLGDLFVNIIVETPKKLSKAQAKLFEELRKLD